MLEAQATRLIPVLAQAWNTLNPPIVTFSKQALQEDQ